MKLLNFKCECGNQDEVYATTEEIQNEVFKEFKCTKCGKLSEPFNVKQNKQVWRFNDTYSVSK